MKTILESIKQILFRIISRLSISQVLVLSFFTVIVIGGILLSLPLSESVGLHGETRQVSLIDGLFTATSAVCVTGLVVKDISKDFNTLGQVLIMILFQFGGLGIVTVSTLAMVLSGARISLRMRFILKEALNRITPRSIVRITLQIVLITLLIELVGTLILFLRWAFEPGFSLSRAAYFALFHSISAFCNAGFSLFSENMAAYAFDPVVNFTITALIILGGIGFTVIMELGAYRRVRRLSLHSKTALSTTAALIVAGTIGILVLDGFGRGSMAGLTMGRKLMGSYFQSVSARTAGFNTINIGAMTTPALLWIVALMFIGASPGGTGGGIKTTTFAIMIATAWAVIKGEKDIEIFRRRIPPETALKAMIIGFISLIILCLSIFGCMMAEAGRQPQLDRSMAQVVFESASAFGTVGLSTGITPQLSFWQKIFIIFTMFIGRVGPLTLAMAMGEAKRRKHYRNPVEHLLIG